MAAQISKIYQRWARCKKRAVTVSKKSLQQLVCGEQGIIIDAPSNPFLASLGFRADKTVKVIARGVCNGPLVCSVDGRNVAIGQDISQDIIVNYAN